jgi:hypothetical protein
MSDEVQALVHRAALVAMEASADGLDPSTAVMAAAIDVCFPPDATNQDIADWMRRCADELEANHPTTKEKRS